MVEKVGVYRWNLKVYTNKKKLSFSLPDNVNNCNKQYMRTFLIFIPTFFLSVQVFASPLGWHRLIYKGDTLYIYEHPLRQLENFYSFNDNLLKEIREKGCITTACVYVPEWEIIDNQLFLANIYSCCYHEDLFKANLASLFKGKAVKGKVKADWFTGSLLSSQWMLIWGWQTEFYIGYRNEKFGYELLNRQELEFRFEKGILIETNFYDNSKSKRSAYCLDREKLMQYIYNNIKWEILPKQDRAFVVALKFSANEEGVIDEAEVKRDYLEILYDTAERRGYYELYDTEAIRVIKSIPEWDVYFSRGKFERMHYYFTIVFSEEYRLKYKEK